jgi:hypothetical protein
MAVGLMAAQPEATSADRSVRFGLPGSRIDPPRGAGGATRDRVEPPVLIVNSGTTLDFRNIGAPHQVAVYDKNLAKNGTTPPTTFADITTTTGGPFFIDDPGGRLALGASGADLSFTFRNTTGAVEQYLVICAFKPHFVDYGMSTVVLVRPESDRRGDNN